MAATIYDTVKEWLKEQDDSDLLSFAREFDNTEEFVWAYKIPTDEYLWMEVGNVNYDADSIMSLILWARKLGDAAYLDWEGKPYDEDEVLSDIKRYHLDELADMIVDCIDYRGEPEVYSSIDTDELYELLKKCPEWVEQYGDED